MKVFARYGTLLRVLSIAANAFSTRHGLRLPIHIKTYVDGWCGYDRILSLLNPYNQMILGIRTQGERLLEARLMILNGLPSSENDRSPTRVPAFRSSEWFSTMPEFTELSYSIPKNPYESGSPRYVY